MTSMADDMGQGFAVTALPSTMDCETCPKGGMAFAGCAQMSCQIAPTPVDAVHALATETMRYALMTTKRPTEWHTVPPVSPG
jgi:hypothetical protein